MKTKHLHLHTRLVLEPGMHMCADVVTAAGDQGHKGDKGDKGDQGPAGKSTGTASCMCSGHTLDEHAVL